VIRAVLFDLDGVLADTERLQWAAYVYDTVVLLAERLQQLRGQLVEVR